MAIAPVLSGVPMNSVLLVYEYAGSATFRLVGAAVTSENLICIVVLAIRIYRQKRKLQ